MRRKVLIQLTEVVFAHKPWGSGVTCPTPGLSAGAPIFIDPLKIDGIWGGSWGQTYVKIDGGTHSVCESAEEIARACKNSGVKIVKTIAPLPSEPA